MKEVWKDIIGYNGVYKISNLGRVKSFSIYPNGRVMSHGLAGHGYPFVNLCNSSGHKPNYIHKLVAIHFVKNPHNFPQVNHKDGIKTNNFPNNLEWCTPKQNIKHAVDNDLIHRGIKNYNARLTEEDVIAIRKDTRTLSVIGDEYGVSFSLISRIKLRQTWKHLL